MAYRKMLPEEAWRISKTDAICYIRNARRTDPGTGQYALTETKAELFEYEAVLNTEEIRNGYDLILTGHSLGGALASMVSRMSGTEAVTVSGADGLALAKINRIVGSRPAECRITNYLTSPEGLSPKNCIQRMMFPGDNNGIVSHVYESNGMTDDAHCVFAFVLFEDGDREKPVLPEEK